MEVLEHIPEEIFTAGLAELRAIDGDAARAAGFGAVHDTRPTLEAVAASIESLA